jgi:RNA polymerase sigma-54 factor
VALTPRLEQRLATALVMTPQLQQAIKLLALSNLELGEFVETELERNPLLERDEGDADGDSPFGDSPQAEPAEASAEADGGLDFDGADPDGAGDESWDLALGRPGDGRGGSGGGFAERGLGFEDSLTKGVSLREHLERQLAIEVADPADRLIGLHLMELMDEAGYVPGDLVQVGATLGCPPARVEAVLGRLQEFDPPGIFARSLAECLALQLRDRDRLDPAMAALLDNLHLLARREFQALARAAQVDLDDLKEMIAEIRSLDPKPALAFDHEVAPPIVPDVLMRPSPGGGWLVELNGDTLPRVLVNNRYYARISRAARSKQDRQYLVERFQSASWLVKSLHQRATTILKVASEIVRQQHAFFVKGVEHLKPLVLKDIAASIDMHESTVSRVTTNKYMATPRGTFELKYFFTAAVGGAAGGPAHSAEAVRHRIKALVEREQPAAVLSDEAIVDRLRGEGIEVARRTVAKYREALRIPSSAERRRAKAAIA